MAELITTLSIIFVTASVALLITERTGQPSILAYIMAGIISGFFIQETEILNLAQLGISFLIFIFGIKFDTERIKTVNKESKTTTLNQITFTGILSFGTGILIGLDTLSSIYFAIVASLSSTLIGIQLIEEEKSSNLIHARVSESVHLLQDIVAVLAVIILSSQSFTITAITQKLAYGSSIILLALIIRTYFFPYLAEKTEGSTELLMLTGLSTLALFTVLSNQLGISTVVGSFAAGLTVASFPYNLEILDTMGSIKDFFSAIFFVTLGSLMTLPNQETIIITASLVFFTAFLKPLIIFLQLVHHGFDSRTSFLTSISLDQISEIALIIIIQGFISGIISTELFNAVVLSAGITMVTSSYTKEKDHTLYELIKNHTNLPEFDRDIKQDESIPGNLQNHFILVGYDVQGKRLAETFKKEGKKFIVIDNDPEKALEAHENNENYIYGNIMEEKTWERAQIQSAELIISTVPFEQVSNRILNLDTKAGKIMRAKNVDEADRLLEKGADYVNLPDILTSELLEEYFEGIKEDDNYIEELRRRNLLEIKEYLEQQEG